MRLADAARRESSTGASSEAQARGGVTQTVAAAPEGAQRGARAAGSGQGRQVRPVASLII